MESSSTTDTSNLRTARGSRGARIASSRGNPSGRQLSPRKKSPSSPRNKSPSANHSDKEQSRPIRGGQNASRGSRVLRPRGRGRIMRRNFRPRQPNFRRRLERAQFAMRNPRGMRRGFRPRMGFRRPFRRFFGRRSIFIKGLPIRMNGRAVFGMMRKEGRIVRTTLLKDNMGQSRGIAFVEFMYPRDALKVVQNYRGRRIDGNNIFVAFKRENNRFRNNNPRFFGRNRINRPFNNFRPGFNSNRFPRQIMPLRNVVGGRGGRGRGRGRGF